MSATERKPVCPRLIDYLVMAGTRSPSKARTVQTPELLRRFPAEEHRDFPLPLEVVCFCQPEGCVTVRPKKQVLREATSFVFALTDKDSGKTRYGVCVNFYRPVERHGILRRVQRASSNTRDSWRKSINRSTDSAFSSDHRSTVAPSDSDRDCSSRRNSETSGAAPPTGRLGVASSAGPLPPPASPRSHRRRPRIRHHTLTSLCFISHHPFFSAFRECLYLLRKLIDACDENASPRRVGASRSNQRDSVWSVLTGRCRETLPAILVHDVREIETWILRLLSAPAPVPGRTRVEVELLSPDLQSRMTFALPDQTRFSLVDFPLHLPLELLGVDKCLQVLTLIILEYKIVIQSRDYNALTTSVMALVALIYPLEYMFPVIPMLPTCMSCAEQLLLAPTPYIIGVPATFLLYKQHFRLPDDVWLVDLDSNSVVPPPTHDELPPLPEPEGSVLRTHLRQILQFPVISTTIYDSDGNALSSMSSTQPIRDLDRVRQPTAALLRSTAADAVGYNPLIFGNDVDSVDVATRVAMIRFFNSQNLLANFSEHTRTLRLYPRPVVAFQINSFLRSRPSVSTFLRRLALTQAVEYLAEWTLLPTNAAFLRVQTGVYDPTLIGDKPKWFWHQLTPVTFAVWSAGGSLAAAIRAASQAESVPTDESGSDSEDARSSASSFSSLSDFVSEMQLSELSPAALLEPVDSGLPSDLDPPAAYRPASSLLLPPTTTWSDTMSTRSSLSSHDETRCSDHERGDDMATFPSRLDTTDRLDSQSVESDTTSLATSPRTVVSTRRHSATLSVSSDASSGTLNSERSGRPTRPLPKPASPTVSRGSCSSPPPTSPRPTPQHPPPVPPRPPPPLPARPPPPLPPRHTPQAFVFDEAVLQSQNYKTVQHASADQRGAQPDQKNAPDKSQLTDPLVGARQTSTEETLLRHMDKARKDVAQTVQRARQVTRTAGRLSRATLEEVTCAGRAKLSGLTGSARRQLSQPLAGAESPPARRQLSHPPTDTNGPPVHCQPPQALARVNSLPTHRQLPQPLVGTNSPSAHRQLPHPLTDAKSPPAHPSHPLTDAKGPPIHLQPSHPLTNTNGPPAHRPLPHPLTDAKRPPTHRQLPHPLTDAKGPPTLRQPSHPPTKSKSIPAHCEPPHLLTDTKSPPAHRQLPHPLTDAKSPPGHRQPPQPLVGTNSPPGNRQLPHPLTDAKSPPAHRQPPQPLAGTNSPPAHRQLPHPLTDAKSPPAHRQPPQPPVGTNSPPTHRRLPHPLTNANDPPTPRQPPQPLAGTGPCATSTTATVVVSVVRSCGCPVPLERRHTYVQTPRDRCQINPTSQDGMQKNSAQTQCAQQGQVPPDQTRVISVPCDRARMIPAPRDRAEQSPASPNLAQKSTATLDQSQYHDHRGRSRSSEPTYRRRSPDRVDQSRSPDPARRSRSPVPVGGDDGPVKHDCLAGSGKAAAPRGHFFTSVGNELTGIAQQTSSLLSDIFGSRAANGERSPSPVADRPGSTEAPARPRSAAAAPFPTARRPARAGLLPTGGDQQRDSLRHLDVNYEQRNTNRTESQVFLKEVIQQVLEGQGIGWLKLNRVRKLTKDEDYRNLVVSRLNLTLDRRPGADDHIDGVCVSRDVWRGMLKLVLAVVAGLEHTFNRHGHGGLASAFQVLEISHTHYWLKAELVDGGERPASSDSAGSSQHAPVFEVTPCSSRKCSAAWSATSPDSDAPREPADQRRRRSLLLRRLTSVDSSGDGGASEAGSITTQAGVLRSRLPPDAPLGCRCAVSDSELDGAVSPLQRRRSATPSLWSSRSSLAAGGRAGAGGRVGTPSPDGSSRTYLFQGMLRKGRSPLWDQMAFWEDTFLDAVSQERDMIGMDQGPGEMLARYNTLSSAGRKRLEHDEDRVLSTMLYNLTAFMVMLEVPKEEVGRKIHRLVGKSHIGLIYSQEVNELLDQIADLHGNDIELKLLGSRQLHRQSFAVHCGVDTTGEMVFMEVRDDGLVLRTVAGIVVERWWFERLVNMTFSPRSRILCLWRRNGCKTQLHKFYTRKCKNLYYCIKEAMERAMERAVARGAGAATGQQLGGEFPVQDLATGEGGLLQVCMGGVGLLFATSKLFIHLNRVRKCFTQKEGIFVLEEFNPKTREIIPRRYKSSMADQICYSVLCVFSYIAAGTKHRQKPQQRLASTS